MFGFTENAQRIFALAIWVAFAGFLLAQHQLVFPYHDDWGYAVLSYTTEQTGISGQMFTLADVISFVADEYKSWSGRVAAFFFQINLFKLGLDYVRVYQVSSILAILLFSLLIAANKRSNILLFVLPPLLYLAMPSYTLVGGVYWFSAAAGYMWGLPFLLCGAYLIKRNDGLNLGSVLLLSVSALFHELIAVVSVSFVLTYMFLCHVSLKRSKELYRNATLSVPVLLFAAVAILAPGNFRRKSVSSYQSENIGDIVLTNFQSMADFWLKSGIAFTLVLVASLVVLSLDEKSFRQSKWRVKVEYWYLVALALVLVLLVALDQYLFIAPALFTVAFGFVLFRFCAGSSTGVVVFSLFVGSVASLVPLLFSPGVPGRALIPYYFLLFSPIVFSYSRVDNLQKFVVAGLGVFVAVTIGLLNVFNIYDGYKRNYQVNVVNDSKLTALSFDIRNGLPATQSVILYKLPAPTFAETMPYERPLIEKWIKKYYEIPSDVRFVWRESK